MKEFRQKAGSILPSIPKNDPPQSRTEFASVSEFMQYLDDEFSTKKKQPEMRDEQKSRST